MQQLMVNGDKLKNQLVRLLLLNSIILVLNEYNNQSENVKSKT